MAGDSKLESNAFADRKEQVMAGDSKLKSNAFADRKEHADEPPQAARERDSNDNAETMANSFLKSMEPSLRSKGGSRERRASRSRPSEYNGASSRHRASRDRTRSPRHRSARDRTRSPRRAHTSERELDQERGRGRQREHEHRRRPRERSRSQGRSRSGNRHRSRGDEVVALHLWAKKLRAWDQAPAGFEGVSAAEAKASGLFPPPGQAVGSRNVASFNPSVLFEHTHRNDNDRFRPSSRGEREFPSTASRQARRLYVGNIPYGIDEDAIAGFFNRVMVQLRIASEADLPVLNIQINHDKNYAFVEFRDAEHATMGMGLDGIMLDRQKLKIRRPKDYIPPPGQDAEPRPPLLNVPGLLSNVVPDSPNKIYIGGLPVHLSEDQVMELLRAFGELKAFNLVKDPATGISRGFAFCEYQDPAITDVACQGLNAMELGDRQLLVQRASLGARNARGQEPPRGPAPAHHAYADASAAHHYPPEAAAPVHHPPPVAAQQFQQAERQHAHSNGAHGSQPTAVVQLLNMVTGPELEDADEYEDIKEDVYDECAKYGPVVDLVIPRPDADANVPGVGKIFVRYSNPGDATLALGALAGKKFADRTVVASYISVEDFESRNY